MTLKNNRNNQKPKPKIKTKKLTCLLLVTTAFSQAYGQLELRKHTINNGNTVASEDRLELMGSIGQVVSGPTSTGGNFSLSGGFWQQNTDLIFKDNLE